MKFIGTRIKEARERNRMTQGHLAKLVGVGRLHITKLESNNELPSIMCLKAIAFVLGMHEIKKALKIILE